MAKGLAKATFGAGCFWGVEAAFRTTPGVIDTAVGYGGGTQENPVYEDVCTGRTGHAEVVEVMFDPGKISFSGLLDVFWACHDPTQRDRQGPDVGPQYRSVIFFHDRDQENQARSALEEMDSSGAFRAPIVTEISPAPVFWWAEDYHQQYLEKRGRKTCR